jgi:opacity protein-like surface antigen
MGAVYRGRHLNLEVDVAVKLLKASLVDEDQRFVARFQREAKLAAGIHHENLIHVTCPPWSYQVTPGGDVDVTTVSVSYGQRKLSDDDFWGNVDEANTVGIEIDHRARGYWVGFELGTQLSDGEEDDAKSDIDEVYAGVRKTFDLGESIIHPYVSIGAAYVQAQAAVDIGSNVDVASDDESVGVYGRVGVFATIAGHLNLGVEYRALFGTDVDLFGVSTDVDYGQFGVSIGYSL